MMEVQEQYEEQEQQFAEGAESEMVSSHDCCCLHVVGGRFRVAAASAFALRSLPFISSTRTILKLRMKRMSRPNDCSFYS